MFKKWSFFGEKSINDSQKCENFDFSQIGQVRCANDASFAAEQLCHRDQFIILLLKIGNVIREMVHIDIDIFHRKNSIF